MEQQTIRFNVPQPDELFKPGTQNNRLFKALLNGGITNVGMCDLFILSYTRRLSDIREAIKPFCLDVTKERVGGGIYAYKIKGIN